MKQVHCNYCNTRYVEHPEIQYEEAAPGEPIHLVRMDIPEEPGERNDCCPKCKTDAFLSDIPGEYNEEIKRA